MQAKPTPGRPDSAVRRPAWRIAGRIFAAIVFISAAVGIGAGVAVLGQFQGTDLTETILNLPGTVQTVVEPRKFFPGRDRLVVLCLGLDRNIMRSRDPKLNGMPYTRGARSDVMMVASLDLASQTVSILSVPRDTRVRLPGRRDYSKINEAHARGGIPYTRKAVEEFLGIEIDHYVVIKQEAIEEIVDALGGLHLKVDKDMDYDDNWGQLHVHLKEGEQTLNGINVVGFIRFRHDPEGDFGRIRRQQQVIQVLAEQVKKPQVLTKARPVIDAIRRYVKTDLTPNQQMALAHLFHKVQQGNVQTLSLPVEDTDTIDGISYVIPDEAKTRIAVDWIVRGNPEAMNRLIRVEVRNASGDPDAYQKVYRYLRHQGFQAWRAGRSAEDDVTRVVQRTNMRGAGRRVLEVLGLTGGVEKIEDGGADVTLYVGKDAASSPILAFADSLPEISDYRPARPRRRYVRRIREEDVEVRIRTVEDGKEEPAAPEVSVEPASPEPEAGGDPGAGTSPAEPPRKPPVDSPGTEG